MRKLVRNLLLGAGAILILAVFVIYNIVTNRIPMNPEGTVGNTAGNLNNRGLFCEYDGLVYFSNAYDRGALYSMTPDERVNPAILNGSRRQRIAKGSGTTIQEVNKLIKQFDETRKMMRMLTAAKPGSKKFPSFRR